MKLPRDIGGSELVKLLLRFGYRQTRQTGSHIRLTSSIRGKEHHLTIPNHSPIKVGTLNSIITSIAEYLEIDKQSVINEFFK
ncbi:MAG: type II toxin-antitoxin system HicA family toxin [Nitrospirae bacterium]|nr:type II toxin-antitoxin system HicA family toxin [Nitrospirota bacterium]